MSDKKQGNLYHLILGLPAEVLSPNHYELLGLDHRTGDADLINKAAADQNRKLLRWQNSDRYAEVRALTFELVRARDVLRNETSRTAYDASLGEWGLEEGPWIVEEPPVSADPNEPLSVRCPECAAGFKLRDRALVGRRLPCPECGFRFVVRPENESPAEVVTVTLLEEGDSDAELAALDNFEEMADLSRPTVGRSRGIVSARPYREVDDYEDYEAPSRPASPKPARRPKPHRPARRSSGRGLAVSGGALMALACVVLLVGLFLQRTASPSAAGHDQLAYLPADCGAVGYYRMGDVARSPFFQDHLTRSVPLRNQVDLFRGRTGMELSDLETVVVGLKDDSRRFSSQSRMSNLHGLQFVAVARANKDWDRSRLIGDHTTSALHNNQTYHTFSPENGSAERWALYLPDARTLIFGSIAEVKAAIDTAGQAPDWRDVEFLQPNYPVITASVMGETSPRPRGPRPAGVGMPPTTNAEMQGSGLVFTGSEVRQVSFLRFDTAADAGHFIRVSSEAEAPRRGFGVSPRGAGSRSFTQHGRTVAVEQGGFHRIADVQYANMVSTPLELLARLGKGPVEPAHGPAQNSADQLNVLINGGPRP